MNPFERWFSRERRDEPELPRTRDEYMNYGSRFAHDEHGPLSSHYSGGSWRDREEERRYWRDREDELNAARDRQAARELDARGRFYGRGYDDDRIYLTHGEDDDRGYATRGWDDDGYASRAWDEERGVQLRDAWLARDERGELVPRDDRGRWYHDDRRRR